MKKKISFGKNKAKEMLSNPPHGKPLTEKQKHLFQAVAHGWKGEIGLNVSPMILQARVHLLNENEQRLYLEHQARHFQKIYQSGGLVSKLGYSDNSPFRGAPSLDIHTPTGQIDMSQTGLPLMANGRFLPPYSGMHQFEPGVVRERPVQSIGKSQTGGGGGLQLGGSTNPPIITHDPNDPRIRAYQDSLDIYNYSNDADIALSKQKSFLRVSKDGASKNVDQAGYRLFKLNGEYPTPIYEHVRQFDYNGHVGTNAVRKYTQPVQPYQYQAPINQYGFTPNSQIGHDIFDGVGTWNETPQRSKLPIPQLDTRTQELTSNNQLSSPQKINPNYFTRSKQQGETGPDTQYFDKKTGVQMKQVGGIVASGRGIGDVQKEKGSGLLMKPSPRQLGGEVWSIEDEAPLEQFGGAVTWQIID